MYLVNFPTFLSKKTTFVTFHFLPTYSTSEKGSTSKGSNLLIKASGDSNKILTKRDSNKIQSTLFISTLDTMTKFVIMTIWLSRNLRSSGDSQWEIIEEYCIKTSSNICFGYLLESPRWGDSNKYPKHMFYEVIRIKQGLSYISFSSLRVLYNSKFILMATSLGTNAVVVTRARYIQNICSMRNKTLPTYQSAH